MSTFDPRRMPAWLAPVWDERSVSQPLSAYPSSVSQLAICGALPSRIARRRTGRARPSISRNTTPGASVRTGVPVRRAMRWTTRNENSLSSSTPATTSSTSVTAEARKATSSAHQNPSMLIRPSVRLSAARSMSASSTRIERNPKTSVSGSRIAAMIGGRIALSAAITAATRSAAQNPLTCAPGTIHAAMSSPSAEISHVRTMCTGLKRRRSSRQVVSGVAWTAGSSVIGALLRGGSCRQHVQGAGVARQSDGRSPG